MASSALRRSLPRPSSLRRLLPSGTPSAAAAASSFRRSFQSEEGAGERESVEEFSNRLLGGQDDKPSFQNHDGAGNSFGRREEGAGKRESVEEFSNQLFGGQDDKRFFRNFDGAGNSFGRRGMRSGMGAFGDRDNFGFGGSMDNFDSLNDGMHEKLDDAARTFHMTDEVEDDDYDFRPDVNYRRGSTYNVKDLDLTRPAAPRNPPRPQFETTTKDVLRKADFRNVRFLSNFLTEAGIIIKRNQTKISAKAQRKVAREIKTARALGLMPFTTMGKRPFIFGRSVEEDPSEEEYGAYDFVEQKDAGLEDIAGDAVPDVETV